MKNKIYQKIFKKIPIKKNSKKQIKKTLKKNKPPRERKHYALLLSVAERKPEPLPQNQTLPENGVSQENAISLYGPSISS